VRKIIHVDMDAFFASIEQRDRPHLHGRPVAVGGEAAVRGVIAAASYEARRFGVRSAMPTKTALRLCPDLVLLPPDFGRYRAASRQLRAILDDFSERVEPLSLDEAYLDVTEDHAGLGTAARTAAQIRQRVRAELSLTCSAGVAPVKFVAKIASDHRKPDGLTVIPPKRVVPFIRPLPIAALWGVGPATAARIASLGAQTIAQLADLPEEDVVAVLGGRGSQLWRMAHGQDDRPVQPHRERKSSSAERTFAEDVLDADAIVATMTGQIRRVCAGLRASGARGRTVNLKLRYADFTTVTRAATLPQPTHDPVVVLDAATALLDRTDAGARPVRLVGVGISGFDQTRPQENRQLLLPF